MLLLAISTCQSESIRVMTFNIRYDSGGGRPSKRPDAWTSTTGAHRRQLVLKVIHESDPDLLCVQEALVNQVEDLQKNLPSHDFYGVGRDDGQQAGEYCGIFFRRDQFERVDAGNFWLNENSAVAGSKFPGTCCARIATWVQLSDRKQPDRKFLLINTHWDHQIQAAREFSAQLIQAQLPVLAQQNPIILAGDLNASPDNVAIPRLLGLKGETKTRLVDCYRRAHPEPQTNEATYHDFRGRTQGQRIDYVLCSDHFSVRAATIVRDHEADRYPSDHFPVMTTLNWNAE